MTIESARLDIRLDSSLAQRLSNPELDGVLANGGVSLGDYNHLAQEVRPLLARGSMTSLYTSFHWSHGTNMSMRTLFSRRSPPTIFALPLIPVPQPSSPATDAPPPSAPHQFDRYRLVPCQ